MTKFLGWICTIIWVVVAVGDSIHCGMGMPLDIDWVDVLLRDWALAIVFVGRLFDEYF